MHNTEKIIKNNWKDKLVKFSKINTGRVASIESDSSIIIHNMPFGNIVYDPIFKENIIKINMGIERNEITHTILNPIVIIKTKNKKDIDISMEIINSDGDAFFLYFND